MDNFTVMNTATMANSTSSKDYIDFTQRIINIAVVSPILACGLVGNLVVVLVILTDRTNHRRTNANTYILSLATADFIFLLSGPVCNLLRYAYGTREWLLPWPRYSCKIAVFLGYASANSAAVIIACFSIERFIAVFYPFITFRSITTAKQYIVVLLVIFMSTAYSTVWLFHIDIKEDNSKECHFNGTRPEYLVLYIVDLCVFFLVPLIIMIPANGMIIYKTVSEGFSEEAVVASVFSRSLLASTAREPGRAQSGLLGRSSSGIGTPNTTARPRHMRLSSISGGNNHRMSFAAASKDSKLATKMLIAVSVVFIMTCAPLRIFTFVNSFLGIVGDDKIMMTWFSHFCRWLWYSSAALNPIIYNALSVRFQKSLLHFMKLGRTSVLSDSLKRSLSSRRFSAANGKLSAGTMSPVSAYRHSQSQANDMSVRLPSVPICQSHCELRLSTYFSYTANESEVARTPSPTFGLDHRYIDDSSSDRRSSMTLMSETVKKLFKV